jgi:hypothetical protein
MQLQHIMLTLFYFIYNLAGYQVPLIHQPRTGAAAVQDMHIAKKEKDHPSWHFRGTNPPRKNTTVWCFKRFSVDVTIYVW